MSNFFDQNTDPTFYNLKLIVESRPGLSSLVKTAEVGAEIRDSLPKTAFADRELRLFPIHTPENAVLSKAYATKQANVSKLVMDRIDNAVSVYGVSVPEEITVKQASEEVYYALEESQQFPIKTAEDISKVEDAIQRNRRKISSQNLAKAASVLIDRATFFGRNVSEATLRDAGLMQCDPEKTAEWLEARSVAVGTPGEAYLKLAEVVRSLDLDSTREELTKIASAIDKLDDHFGLRKNYGTSLPTPQETVFNEKTAMGSTLELAGKQVPVDALMKFDPKMYGDILGEDLVDDITGSDGELSKGDLLAILPTLPSDMKSLLVKKLGL